MEWIERQGKGDLTNPSLLYQFVGVNSCLIDYRRNPHEDKVITTLMDDIADRNATIKELKEKLQKAPS